MNEIVYNILRKCVETPKSVSLESKTYFHMIYVRVKFKGNYLVTLKFNSELNKYSCETFTNTLTDKECRRILRGMEHVEAVKIRSL